MAQYALSLKQPWAALLVHGLKSIEVRRWPTARRGRILIHAARVPDTRPEAWRQVPEELRRTAALLGGVIGKAELTDCITYASADSFNADQARHLNPLAWFQPPRMHGFVFKEQVVLPFRALSGWMRFFPVEE